MDFLNTLPVKLQRYTARYLLFALLLILLCVFLIWPIIQAVQGAFFSPQGQFTLQYFFAPGLGVLRDIAYQQGIINSLTIAIAVTIGCFILALPLSILSARYTFAGKNLLVGLCLVPLILPPFVGAIGLQAILGRFGAFNALLVSTGVISAHQPGIDFLGGAVGGQFWGVVIMEVLHLYPILFLNLSAALANLDPTLEEAASNLGAGPLRRFWRCTLPMIMPGIFAGATIVFIWSFTELGTPLMFGYYKVMPVQVFWGITQMSGNPRPYALVVVMLAVAIGCYLVGKLLIGRRSYIMQSKASVASVTKKLTGWRSYSACALFVIVIFLAILPHLGVILTSFSTDGGWYRSILPQGFTTSHYASALSQSLAMESILNSLVYAALAMAICVVVGLAIAHLTVRGKVKGGWILDSLGMLPLAVPGIIMAFGYVAMTLSWPMPQLAGFFRAQGWDTLASMCQVTGQAPNPILFLVIAYAVRRLPYILRSAAAGLEQTSGELEEAALNLGASKMTTMRKIVVPLIMANLIAGAILVFAFSMLEVSDSLILAQKQEFFPMTKAIWVFFNRLGDGPYIASAMGVWGMALLTVTLVGAATLLGKKMGAIFKI